MGAIRDVLAIIGQKAATRILPSPQGMTVGGRVAFPKSGTYQINMQKGYRDNPIVAACIGLMSSTMNEPPLGVIDQNGNVSLNHPVSVIFRRPNPNQGQAQFWAIVWQFLNISGNAYLRKVRAQAGNLAGFLVYSDAHVSPLLDEYGWVKGYQYSSGGHTETWPVEAVIHIRHPLYIDPERTYLGLSPIDVAWPKILTYNELQSTMYSLMASNGVPSGVLTAPNDIPSGQVTQLKKQLEKRRNAKGIERTEPLVLGSGMKYEAMGLDASRMQAKELTIELEAAICAAFRIHPSVIGSSAGINISTYNNLTSAYAEFTTLLRVPLWNAIEEQLESGLAKEYPGIQLGFDLSQVQALQPDVDKVIYPVIAEFTNGIITLNETRGKLGFEAVEDGEQFAFERLAVAPVGTMSAVTDAPEGDAIESVESRVVKWSEPHAVKYWQAQNNVVEQAADRMRNDALIMIDDAFKSAAKRIKARKDSPADAIDIEQLVAEFMVRTGAVREELLDKIIRLTIETADGKFTDVQSDIDDIRDAQTRETQSNLRTSCETLRREVTRITEAYAGDPDAMRRALAGRFEAISESRAATIARTTARAQATAVQNETVRGLNKRETDPNRKVVQVWLSERDDDVRKTHEALDGKWIEQGQTWEQYQPGITSGPGVGTDPAQVINCRCVMRATRLNRLQR